MIEETAENLGIDIFRCEQGVLVIRKEINKMFSMRAEFRDPTNIWSWGWVGYGVSALSLDGDFRKLTDESYFTC